MRELIDLGVGDSMQINCLNTKKNKSIGTIYIQDSTIKPIFSFLDFKIHRKINIIPVLAIDFSLSNLTFDDKKCIHTTKAGVQNDYKEIIDALTHGYKHLSKYMMGYGIGARTIPKIGETSDCFSVSGDIFNPFFNLEDLYEMYKDSLKRCELSMPINYHKVLEVVADYARYERENYECRNYFVLTYVTVGVIDDIKETLGELKQLGDIPLSVQMIRVRNP